MPMSGTKRNKAHIKILNKSGPRIGPRGTSKRISLQELYVVFILALCLLFFKYENRSFKDGMSNSFARSLARHKS